MKQGQNNELDFELTVVL